MKLGEEFERYKEFVVQEIENHDETERVLQRIITRNEVNIDELEKALSMPRKHYSHIDKLQAADIILQKN